MIDELTALQVQLALLTYRLPRLTNLWSHLKRQSAGARGKSNGGVGLRGPGEKQIETDRREIRSKISVLTAAINAGSAHPFLMSIMLFTIDDYCLFLLCMSIVCEFDPFDPV